MEEEERNPRPPRPEHVNAYEEGLKTLRAACGEIDDPFEAYEIAYDCGRQEMLDEMIPMIRKSFIGRYGHTEEEADDFIQELVEQVSE